MFFTALLTFATFSVVSMTVDPESPQNIALNISSYVSIIVALIALIGTFISRKIKSPADELARADFAYKKIAERLEEVNNDRKYLQSVIDTLRDQLTKFDKDATISMDDRRKLRNLVGEGEHRIEQLGEENRILQDRLGNIAEKVRIGVPITLSDVYGIDNDIRTPTLEEIELTTPPKEMAQLAEYRRRTKENQ